MVGVTVPTQHDLHATPASGTQLMSGAELQANAISTVLRGLPMRDGPAWWVVACTALMAAAAPVAGLRWGVARIACVAAILAPAFVAAAWLAFMAGIMVSVVAPLVALGAGSLGAMAMAHMAVAGRQRALAWYSQALEREVDARTEELRLAQVEVVQRLAQAAESREADTGEHISRVGTLCESLAVALGMETEEARLLGLATALHDVGKIGVPDRVLLKKGKLDEDEWAIMRAHADAGGDILAGSRAALLRCAEDIARTHHEHWDGGGYPRGVAGSDIPLAGRICAIYDVFDALLSRRPYKEPWTLEEALDEIRRLSGSRFEPRIVDVFMGIAPRLHEEPGYARRAARPVLRAA